MIRSRPADPRLLDALDRLAIEIVGVTTLALAEVASDLELTFAQWRVLVVVGGQGEMRVGEIAARIGASLPSTSRMIGRLERRGLVTGDRDPRDRRARLMRLSAAGTRTRQEVLRRRRSRLASALSRQPALPPGLLEGLRTLAAALDEYA